MRRYPYKPIPAQDVQGSVEKELQRIAEAIAVEINLLVVHHEGTVDVGTTEDTDWIGIGTTPNLEEPDTVWTPGSGKWTAPETAYYYWDAWVNIDGTAGGQEATYTLEVYKDGVLFETPASVQQSSTRAAQLAVSDLHKLEKGDELTFKLKAIKVSGSTNTADYYAHIIIKREVIV